MNNAALTAALEAADTLALGVTHWDVDVIVKRAARRIAFVIVKAYGFGTDGIRYCYSAQISYFPGEEGTEIHVFPCGGVGERLASVEEARAYWAPEKGAGSFEPLRQSA